MSRSTDFQLGRLMEKMKQQDKKIKRLRRLVDSEDEDDMMSIERYEE